MTDTGRQSAPETGASASPATSASRGRGGVRGPLGDLGMSELRHPTEPARFALALVALAVAVSAAVFVLISLKEITMLLVLFALIIIMVLVIWVAIQVMRIRLLGDAVLVSSQTLPEVQEVVDTVRDRSATADASTSRRRQDQQRAVRGRRAHYAHHVLRCPRAGRGRRGARRSRQSRRATAAAVHAGDLRRGAEGSLCPVVVPAVHRLQHDRADRVRLPVCFAVLPGHRLLGGSHRARLLRGPRGQPACRLPCAGR